jgi:hypothetical protein
MARLVIPPGFGHLALSLRNASNGKVCIITDGFKVRTPPVVQADMDSLAGALRTALSNVYDSSWVLGPCAFLLGNDGPPLRFDGASTSNGVRSSQANPPPQVSYLINKTTGFAVREFRGRAYWPYGGANTTIDEAGLMIGGEATIVNTAVTAWSAALNSAANNTSGQYLLHTSATAPTAVISFFRENAVATQRRRLVRPVS